jgi:hypothetical protein
LGFAPWLCAAAGALAVACNADGRDSTPETDILEVDGLQDDEGSAVGQRKQGLLSVTEDLGLTQGSGPVSRDLASATTHYCWLSRVQGHFQGGGERVSVFVHDGNWRLRIESGQTEVSAGARCTPLNGTTGPMVVTSQVNWGQGEGRKFLASEDRHTACALNRVAGHFEGSGEVVEVVAADDSWWLQGSSAQQGVSAGARCVQSVTYTGSKGHSTTCRNPTVDPTVNCSPRTRAISADNFVALDVRIACGLGKMSGKFKGGEEIVGIESENREWILRASGGQESTFSTSGHCFF